MWQGLSEAQGHDRGEADKLQLERRWRFSAKGAPERLKVYAAEPS